MKSNNNVVLSLVWAACGIAAPSHALTFAEGTFTAADWQQITVEQTGVGTLSFSVQNNLNGNPDSFWQQLFQRPQTSGLDTSASRVANINGLFVYDPAVSGALEAMDFSIDLRGIGSNFTFATTGSFRPAILQDGVVYTVASSDRSAPRGQWVQQQWSFTDESQWAPNSGIGAPDFSADGAPIAFGYRFGLGTNCTSSNGCVGGAAFSGVDNYSVTLTSAVPEPASVALLLAGLGLLAGYRRARGSANRA